MNGERRRIRRSLALHAAVILLVTIPVVSACENDEEGDPAPTLSGTDQETPAADSSATPAESSEVNLESGPALVWGSGTYGVVLVHGAIYDAASWSDQAEAIAAQGFAVIALEDVTAGETRAAMEYLRQTFGVTHVALVGASAGTGAVMVTARSQTPETLPAVDLVVVLAGGGTASDLEVPSVLFISAEGDRRAAIAAERMVDETTRDPDDVLIVPGSAHAQALFDEPEGEQVLSAILNRLAERQAEVETEP